MELPTPSHSIVIVSGLPGSGKSYFAERLAAELNAVYLSSDKIRDHLQAKGRYSFKDKMHVYLHMAELTARHLNRKRTVVLDATFYHQAMRNLFAELALKHHCRTAFILVWTSKELYHKRLKEPRKDSEADLGVYESLKALFEPYVTEHLELFSGQDNITEMLASATGYLQNSEDG